MKQKNDFCYLKLDVGYNIELQSEESFKKSIINGLKNRFCKNLLIILTVSINVKHEVCNKRDERIDSIKFFLMLLVIAGHVFSKIGTQWPSGYCRIMWQWIYMFHMSHLSVTPLLIRE